MGKVLAAGAGGTAVAPGPQELPHAGTKLSLGVPRGRAVCLGHSGPATGMGFLCL